MDEEQWLTRCAARYETRALVHLNVARGFARATLEVAKEDDWEYYRDKPEEAADEDMSHWDDDGEQ